ncbi:MAG: methyltransferase [Oscillospiraceae bacterium]|jgi:hypothetical protein|nr:methyltransferase [Oscillospiraceae bacterium]
MSKIPYSDAELKIAYERPGAMPGFPSTPEYSFPVSQREGVLAALNHEPIWEITGLEVSYFAPRLNPDNIARASVMDGSGSGLGVGGGLDIFGVDWEFVPSVGGSMVRPGGTPLLTDVNDWERVVKFPDVTKWDWETAKAENAELFKGGKFVSMWILNGFFERLISFMEFENAAFALVDEEQQDAVKALFNRLADFYIELIDVELKHFPQLDGFFVHDDWGSQRAPFFSPKIAEELLVPAMRKLTDYIHSRGKYAELHSCGHLLLQVPNMIAAGWDIWCPQMLNDTHKIYELYGDKIIIGVSPDVHSNDFGKISTETEAEQIAAADSFAKSFCKQDKPSFFNMYASMTLTPAYRSALYKASRLAYGRG